ncbi:AFG2-interacting ribosome maturation factor-like isoform X1 [Acipenser ruthenus]|uniref:AFG2-interacting ribosome maturation factor-like isoform X1 n=2 Tax=Acipenser ruthenus TaxID=7906 RepID=UPI0027415665|nr:AFG2-interacting ribosome maturation factor-like isoform X1 [Acipenser ruthenus]
MHDSMSKQAAILSVHQATKKCFEVIGQQQSVWDCTLADCLPLLSSLSSLGEQLQSCSKVRFKNTPLQGFPELEQRLRYKLIQAVETVLGKLGEKMSVLQTVRDAVSNQVATVFQQYEQHADTIGLSASIERSSLAPSVADMLEWLQDIDRFYRNQFLKRKLLLQTIKPDNFSHMQALPQSWNRVSTQKGQELIQDTLMKVSFFMDSH